MKLKGIGSRCVNLFVEEIQQGIIDFARLPEVQLIELFIGELVEMDIEIGD